MTENIIITLEKVSHEYSNTILQSCVLDMLVNVIDFLTVQPQVSILKIISRVCKSFSDKDEELESKILPLLPIVNNIMQNSDKIEEISVEVYLNITKRVYKLYEGDRDKMEQKINSVGLSNDCVRLLMSTADRYVSSGDAKSHVIVLNLFTILKKFAFMSADLSQELLKQRVDRLILKSLDN